jgi:hypothetical protein
LLHFGVFATSKVVRTPKLFSAGNMQHFFSQVFSTDQLLQELSWTRIAVGPAVAISPAAVPSASQALPDPNTAVLLPPS